MSLPSTAWQKYVTMLLKISFTAAHQFFEYLDHHDVTTETGKEAAIEYAYALATKYGEASAAVACEAYDATAEAAGVIVPPALPAETATFEEVATAINGTINQDLPNESISGAVGRLVKQAGADTTLQNALRDGAEWAWIPSGDTCAFCIMLASNGWQRASKKALRRGHAEHIHANCDCNYAVQFNGKPSYDFFDPDVYKEIYDNADAGAWWEKVNVIRQNIYEKNGDKIRAQKRAAYRRRKERLELKKKNGGATQ